MEHAKFVPHTSNIIIEKKQKVGERTESLPGPSSLSKVESSFGVALESRERDKKPS